MWTFKQMWDWLWERPAASRSPRLAPLHPGLASELEDLAGRMELASRGMRRHICLAREVDSTRGDVESLKLRADRLEYRLQQLEDLVQSERNTKEIEPAKMFPGTNRTPRGRWGGRGRWQPGPQKVS